MTNKEERRAAILTYDLELMKELLYIDDDFDVVQIQLRKDFTNERVEIVIEGEALPPVEKAALSLPYATLVVHTKQTVDRVEIKF